MFGSVLGVSGVLGSAPQTFCGWVNKVGRNTSRFSLGGLGLGSVHVMTVRTREAKNGQHWASWADSLESDTQPPPHSGGFHLKRGLT